jgi:hypothetical protein
VPDIKISPGGILPRDMTDRQWSSYTATAQAAYYRSGQTAYDTGTGFWIGDVAGVPKLSIGNSAGNKVTWDGTDLSIVGNLVLGSGNFLRSGQTAYDTGTGFWIGNDGGTPKFSLGNSASNKLTWNGTTLTVSGQIELNNAQTFTPTWVGFDASPPTGDFSYIDMGTFAIIYSTASRTGTSDGAFFDSLAFSGVPAGIRPAVTQTAAVLAVDNGNAVLARATITSGGLVTFNIGRVVGTQIQFDSALWTTSGVKGTIAGFNMLYSL